MLLTACLAILEAQAYQALALPHPQAEPCEPCEALSRRRVDEKPESGLAGGFAFLNATRAAGNAIVKTRWSGGESFEAQISDAWSPITTVVEPEVPVETLINSEGDKLVSLTSQTDTPIEGRAITTIDDLSKPTQQPIINESITEPVKLIQRTGGTFEPLLVMDPATQMGYSIFDYPIDTKAPPSQIPQRNDHPAPRKGISKKGPIGTNKFYANFFLDDQTTPCYAHPYSLSWSGGKLRPGSWGMAISHTEEYQRFWGPDVYNIGATNYFGAPVGIHSIIISATNLNAGSVLTTSSITSFGVTVHLRPSQGADPAITFPVVQGMGFISANFYGATPLLQSGVLFKTLTRVADPKTGVSKFVVELEDGKTWYIYAVSATEASLDIKLVSRHELKATSGFFGTIQVAKETNNGKAQAAYDVVVGAYPVDLKLKGSVDGSAGEYTFEWEKAGVHQNSSLLMWAFPHHIQSFDLATSAKITMLTVPLTVKGVASAVLADSWTMVETDLPVDMGFAPWDADRGSLDKLPNAAKGFIRTIAQQEMSQDIYGQSGGPSMYFSGKVLAKFASVIYTMSELLGDRALAASGLDKLKEAFARFRSNRQDEPLTYESELPEIP